MVDNNIILRLYNSQDRLAVREISYETADRGNSAENIFGDREVLADLLTCYYTDYEPQSLWVAEHERRVIGYLTGCLDSRRYLRIMGWRLWPCILIKAIFRGALWRPQTWRLFKATVMTLCQGKLRREIPFDKYPAHLHVNVRKNFRGQKIGKRLIERFIVQVKAAWLNGIHLSTHEDNISARKFFEYLGFMELSRYPTINISSEHKRITHTIIYVMDLRNHNPL